jgi:hypothetical protein
MDAIKKFQSVAGTGNPVYITDVTYPTELANILGSALNNFGRTAYILSGFDADGSNFTPGVVWFSGQVYAFEGTSVPGGQYLFAGTRQADSRITIDGQAYNAYTEYYLFTATTNTSANGTLVDSAVLSTAMINRLKAPLIPAGSVTPDKLSMSPANQYRPWKINIQVSGIDATDHTVGAVPVVYKGGTGDHFGVAGTAAWAEVNGIWSLRITIPRTGSKALMPNFAFMCNGDFGGFPPVVPTAEYSGGVSGMDSTGLSIELYNVTSTFLALDVLFWGGY